MSTISFKIDYNSVNMTNPEMGSEFLARKSRYILENKLVFDDPVILRAGLYTRLSVEDGDNEISDSIATQLAIGVGFFALNQGLIHVKTYIDDGYSGLDFDRPDFQQMMDDLKAGLINCVVVKDVSRANSKSASFIYYECSNYLNSDRRNCSSHYIKGETIAAEITRRLLRFAEIVLGTEFKKNIIEPLQAELVVIRKQVLDIRDQAAKAQNEFAENFENYMDRKISKDQFSQNAIPIRERMKRLEVEEREQRQIMDGMDAKMDSIMTIKQLLRGFMKSGELTKDIVDTTVDRIIVGAEHTFIVEYKLIFDAYKST